MVKLSNGLAKTRSPLWNLIPLAVALTLAIPATSAQASDVHEVTYTSFFDGKNDNLLDSGWSSCSPKITWSVDMGSLKPTVAKVEINRLKSSFEQWSSATGLSFEYIGPHSMTYNASTHHLTAPNMPTTQHIAVAVLSSSESPLLRGKVVGFGMPSLVMDSSNEIVGGMLAIKEEVVRANSKKDPKFLDSLYLHELGHVIGLGHVSDDSQIMFPTINRKTVLGAGDKAGGSAITQSCQ